MKNQVWLEKKKNLIMEKPIGYFETKTAKVIFYGLICIVPAFVIIFGIVSFFMGPSSRQVMIERYSNEAIHGVVDSVYDDTYNHNARMVILTNKMVYTVEPEWVIDIQKGDSLNKNKGSFFFEVYRKPNKKLVLDYRTLIPPEK